VKASREKGISENDNKNKHFLEKKKEKKEMSTRGKRARILKWRGSYVLEGMGLGEHK